MGLVRQKELFSDRWRSVGPREPSELAIQIAIVQHLKYFARKDCLYWHTPNGEQRDARTGAKLRAMGTLAGVADLVFIWPGPAGPHVLFLELKARGRKPSDEQCAFRDAAVSIGAHYEFTDNLDDALKILRSYDILKPRR